MSGAAILWRCAGGARWRVLGGVAARVAQSLFLALGFYAAVTVIMVLTTAGTVHRDHVTQVAVLSILSLSGQLVMGWLAARLSWLAAYEVVAELRIAVLNHLITLPQTSLGGRTRADISALVTSDTQTVEEFLSDALPRAGQVLGFPLAVIVVVSFHDPVLGLALAAPIVAVWPVMAVSGRRLSELGDERQGKQANAAAAMIDLVASAPALWLYSGEQRSLSYYSRAVNAFREVSVKMVHRLVVPSGAAGLVVQSGLPLILAVGGWRLTNGEVTDTRVVVAVVATLAVGVYQPVHGVLAAGESWQLTQAAIRRAVDVLRLPPLPAPRQPRQPSDNGVELSGVSYTYADGVPALREVSFRVAPGTTTALVGRSGSGKSTLLSLIERGDDPGEGVVLIGGVDVRDMDTVTRCRTITQVFQDIHLFPGTVADNIAVGNPGASRDQIIAAARTAQAHRFITSLDDGYDTVLGEDGAGLSGGQRQRLSIARAVVSDAPVVLLDEATASLDPVSEAAVLRALDELCRERTAIIVTHRLSTIVRADDIVVLDGGRCVQRGPHRELLAAGGTYAQLWATLRESETWALNRGSGDANPADGAAVAH